MPVVAHKIPEIVVPGKPLGRHYKWDPRNDPYIYRRADHLRTLVSILHARHAAILDQGQVGSCTGNAKTGELATDPFYETFPAGFVFDEKLALKLYSAAEVIDGDGPYPPNDNGSTGQSVSQASKNLGFESGYQHATDVTSMATALQTTPVIIGINWYSSFDSPAAGSGLINISKGAYVRGGHEVVVRGVDPSSSIFYADNSWGTSWGVNGSFQIPFAVMDRLFTEGGDCTVSVPLSSPAPTPTPTPSVATAADKALDAVASPWAQKTRVRTDLVALKAAIQQWETDSGLA